MKFCPRCGKKGITGDFCSKCHAEMVGSILEFSEIEIKVCPLCMRYFYRNKWVRFDSLAVVARKIAKDNIKKRVNAEIRPLLPEIEYRPGRKYSFEIEVKLSPKEKYYLPAKLEMVTCGRCSRAGTQYFEGVLQLRNPTQEITDFISSDVRKHKDRGIFITSEKKRPKGIDFYMTSQRYLQNLGRKLQKNFGGILKINPRIYSRDRQTSKDVYRVNVYFEVLPYSTGDIVKFSSKLIKVSSIGKHVAGINILTGKRTSFSSKENVEVLEKKKAEVVKEYPEIEILDPETYQPVKVWNRVKAKTGDKVEIVRDENRVYIV